MIGDDAPLRYASPMDARRAPDLDRSPPLADSDFVDEPITDADWAAMSDAERAFIQEGLDAADRGDLMPHDEVMTYLHRLRDEFAAK